MKVFIADQFPESALAELAQDGFDVAFDPNLRGDELAQTIVAAQVLVARSTPVTAPMLAARRGSLEQST